MNRLFIRLLYEEDRVLEITNVTEILLGKYEFLGYYVIVKYCSQPSPSCVLVLHETSMFPCMKVLTKLFCEFGYKVMCLKLHRSLCYRVSLSKLLLLII